MSNIHARAINLARRYSERNENDLLQENFFEDMNESSNSNAYSEDFCANFLDTRGRFNNNAPQIPAECEKFANIRVALQRRKTNQEDEAVAFAGMDAGSAMDARRARAHGGLSGAQIRRRMTSQGQQKDRSQSWFF